MSIIHDALNKLEKEKEKTKSLELDDSRQHQKPPSRETSPPSKPSPPIKEPSRKVEERRPEKGAGKSFFSLPSFSKNLVGIDVGFSTVKLVTLRRSGGGYLLAGAGSEKILPGMKEKGVVDALSSLAASQNVEKGTTASSFNSKSLITSQITLPKMPEADLGEAVRWEVKKEIDFSDEAVIDFVINDELSEEGKKKLAITAFAVKKDEVLKHVELLKAASFRPCVVDATSMALLSAFDYNYGWKKDERYAVIDIGASQTTLAIMSNKTLRLTRTINVAGNDITWGIQDAEEIDFQEAEGKKIQFSGNIENAPISVQNAFRTFVEDITEEIRRSFLYYEAQMREGKIDQIYLAGGSALIEGLVEYIADHIGIPAVIYDPLRRLNVKGSGRCSEIINQPPLFVEALGLALRKKER